MSDLHEAIAVYAADKLANARELRARATAGQFDAADHRRLAHYEASLTLLERRAPKLAHVRQLRFELWALPALPLPGTAPVTGRHGPEGPGQPLG